MVVLAVMVAASIVSWLAGAAHALRMGMAAMFVFTGVAHFVPRARDEMIHMIPPMFPRPAVLVALTGLFELAGAAGLVMPAIANVSAYALMALLVAMFPANWHAARKKLQVAGRPATPLAIRLPLQLFWMAALYWG